MQLDPDAQLLLDAMIKAGRPAFETLSPVRHASRCATIRAALKQPQPPVAEVRELTAQGPHGEIPLRLYRSQPRSPGEAQPVTVFFHGGGWVFGDLETHDNLCRSLANVARVRRGLSDYRLAPESKFPAAVDDSFAATQWVADNAQTLGFDASRLAVAGDSAGGQSRDRRQPDGGAQWCDQDRLPGSALSDHRSRADVRLVPSRRRAIQSDDGGDALVSRTLPVSSR